MHIHPSTFWAILAALTLYTLVLLGLSYRAKRRSGESGYFDAGKKLSPTTVFLMVTALWTSSTIAMEIDTGFADGWSAVWLGASTALLSILVSWLAPRFLRLGYTTNSELLGRAYGPLVRRLTGVVIGATFPIFAMSNALFAGYFLHALLGWPLWFSLVATTFLLLATVQFAGLESLAAIQGVNLVFILLALGLLVVLVHGLPAHPLTVGHHPSPVANATILVWLGTNLLNVFSAQAEFQAVVAAKNARRAQLAVLASSLFVGLVVFAATWVGRQARIDLGAVPGGGLSAVSHLVLTQASPLEAVLIAVGIWGLALTWCGPLLFSGAVSLGRDAISASVRWTKMALVGEAGLMISLALWRPDALAWWSVFGLTVRNAGVVGPTLALLLWGDRVPRWSVVGAIGAGIAAGVGLNAATGFSAVHFLWGINPMWISQTVSLVVLAFGRWWSSPHRSESALWLAIALGLLMAEASGNVLPVSLRGITLLATSGLFFALTHLVLEHAKKASNSKPSWQLLDDNVASE